MLQDIDERLCAIVHIQLAEDIGQMILHRLLAHEKSLRNILVAESFRDTCQYINLTGCEAL